MQNSVKILNYFYKNFSISLNFFIDIEKKNDVKYRLMIKIGEKHLSKISICIPVCKTEKYLNSCLESIATQDFKNIEIIIVDDNDKSYFENLKSESSLKIIKNFKKNHKKDNFNIKFIKHGKNKGLVEARRSAIYEASGKYIMFLDSDDSLPENSIKFLFDEAENSNADIVQGKANICLKNENLENASEDEKNRLKIMEKSDKVFSGTLLERQIFDDFLLNSNHSGFLWGKIFKRELCLECFNIIPPVFCTFGEDFLTYFYLSLFAKKYRGIEKSVYNYYINTGISSNKKIDSLEEWEKICSTASVFTILLSWIQEEGRCGETSLLEGVADKSNSAWERGEGFPLLTNEEIQKVQDFAKFYATNNLLQLKKSVVQELQNQAYEKLCDFWGEKMIKKIEENLGKR